MKRKKLGKKLGAWRERLRGAFEYLIRESVLFTSESVYVVYSWSFGCLISNYGAKLTEWCLLLRVCMLFTPGVHNLAERVHVVDCSVTTALNSLGECVLFSTESVLFTTESAYVPAADTSVEAG